MLVVPFGRQRVKAVVVEVAETSDLPPDRLAEPLEALEAGVPPRWSNWAAGCGKSAPRQPADSAWCCRPRQRRGRQERPAAGGAGGGHRGWRGTAGGERLGLRQKGVLRALAADPPGAGVELEPAAHPAARGQGLVRPGRLSAGGDPAGLHEGVRLTGAQRAAVHAITVESKAAAPSAPRRHRLGRDQGLSPARPGGARSREGRNRPSSASMDPHQRW